MPGDNLIDDLRAILGRDPRTVIDVGAHWGDTTETYLNAFPAARVVALEPELENHRRATQRLAPYGARVSLRRLALSDQPGSVVLHVNSHHGTHSLLEVGEQRYWAAFAEGVGTQTVSAVTLDGLAAEFGLDEIDLLHMDIQGGELAALRGARRLLATRAIGLVYCEVEFYALYRDQPLFWDVAAHLRAFGYQFYSFYDRYYHDANPSVLSWADALFVANRFLRLPEHARPDAAPTSAGSG